MTKIQSEIELENKVAEMVNNPQPVKPKLEPSRYYKLHNDHFIFLKQLEYAINKSSNIHKFINNQWKKVFPEKPFPEGRTLQKLKVALQYGLVYNAHVRTHIKPTEKFLTNYRRSTDFSSGVDELNTCLSKFEDYNSLSKIIIQGVNMTTKKKVKAKAKVEKRVKEKKLTMASFICDLLLERKYKDEEIVKKTKAKFPGKKPAVLNVRDLRSWINAGKRAGIDAPKNPIVEIDPPAPKEKVKPSGKVEPKVKAKKKVKAKSK